MKTMTLDDLLKNPLTENDKNIRANARPIATGDCPEQTDEQLKQFKPWYEVHPKGNDIYKVSVKKTAVSLRIDNDVLAALKATGKGYQTRINNIDYYLIHASNILFRNKIYLFISKYHT